jgi:FAD binding domain/Berberine and berberine like
MTVAIATPELASSLRGRLITEDDVDYDSARRVFNAMIDRRPRFIVQTTDEADVMAAVKFAGQEGLPLSVRGGGHGVAGFAMNDGGIVIDLSLMKGIRVDPVRRTVRVQGGCTWGDVDHATHAFGLATPGGAISTTGVAGLTLGGGIGHLTRRCGLSCDNLIAADVVTADGEFVVTNEKENADLLWGLRGGGGNFGVVTSFEFRLHEVSTVYAGPLLWRLDRAHEALKFYREFIAAAPEELNALFAFLVVPAGPPWPEHLHNKTMCGCAVCYSGPLEDAEEALRPLRDFGPPALDGLGPMPFPMLQTAFDEENPWGLHNYWKGDFYTELNDDVIDAHLKFAPRIPNIFSGAMTFPLNGAAQRVGKNATAWSYRDANFATVIYAADADPEQTPGQTEWVRDYWSALHPHSAGGSYVNFLMDEGQDSVAASYRDNYGRLVELKRKYDPGNLLRMNQNIDPQGGP